MDPQKAIPAPPLTFLQRLGKQRNALGNMALAAACCILATRIIGQDNELRSQRAAYRASEGYYEAEVDRMNLENREFEQAVREELRKGSSNLVQRLESLLAEFNASRQSIQDNLEGTHSLFSKSLNLNSQQWRPIQTLRVHSPELRNVGLGMHCAYCALSGISNLLKCDHTDLVVTYPT